MRKTPRSSREIIAVAFFMVVPVLVFTLMHGGQGQGRGNIIAATPLPSNPGNDPSLSGGSVNASFGYANITAFNFTITYQSYSNSSPSFINLTLIHMNGTQNITMQKINPSASNFISGVTYQKVYHFPSIGNYSYYFRASNGANISRYPAIANLSGPSIIWLRNYTMKQVTFHWINPSNATMQNDPHYYSVYGDLMYNYNLPFQQTAYNHDFNQTQVSLFGFMRLVPLAWSDTNRRTLNVSESDDQAKYTIIAFSNKVWNPTQNGSATLWYRIAPQYFFAEEDVLLENGLKVYNASFQYVVYKNSSISLSYDYVNFNFPATETVGINFGDGRFYTPYTFSTNLTKISLFFNYNYLNTTRICNYEVSPVSGSEVTTFNFTLNYQNLENRGPYTITLTLDGNNYTLNPVNNNDLNYVDGKWYYHVIQVLSPNLTHSYSFSLLGPDGSWHSPSFSGPIIIPSNISNYTVNKRFDFVFYPSQANWSTVTLFSMKLVNLPFNFTYYGFNFSQLTIFSGGFVRFTGVTSSSTPVPGSTNENSWLSINILGDQFYLDIYNSNITYKTFPDKIVINYYDVYYSSFDFLGDFQLILFSNGDIVFSFLDLMHVNALNPGGINFGDGLHYSVLPISQTKIPMTNQSFMFNLNHPNVGVSTKITPSGSLFTTSQQILFNASYASPSGVPLSSVNCTITGQSFQHVPFSVKTEEMSLDLHSFVNYTSGATALFRTTLPAGIYDASYRFYDTSYRVNDSYGHVFTNDTIFHFIVDDPPVVTGINPQANTGNNLYGIVGRLFTIKVNYNDSEGLPPAYLNIRWDGVNYTMNPSSSDFSTIVLYTESFNLTHGAHVFSVLYKDQYWPNQFFVYTNQTIIARYAPVITIISLPPATIFNPYVQYQISVTITCAEPGSEILTKYISIDGKTNITLTFQAGSPNTYTASVSLGDGQHTISIVASDGYNVVIWPVAGTQFNVTVVDLPLILGIIIPIAAVASILILYQLRKRKQKSIQQDMLKKQILAKKLRQRSVPGDIEVKYKERQKESDALNAADAIPAAQSVVKKSAAVRKVATSGQPARKQAPATIGHQKPASGGGSHPRDKSKFAPRISDTTTIINRTVLKDYIERQRKAGIKELHFIKIKNDLNIISQNKSSRLYRLLQELVKDNLLVRKGSLYIIV